MNESNPATLREALSEIIADLRRREKRNLNSAHASLRGFAEAAGYAADQLEKVAALAASGTEAAPCTCKSMEGPATCPSHGEPLYRQPAQAAASEGREPDGSLAEDVLAAFCALLDEKDNGAEHTAESMTGRIMDVITPHLGKCCSLRQSAAPSGGAATRLEERRTRANQWAEDHRERTGAGPGTPGYINAYMCGYFNHPQVSSKGLTATIIEQFEAATLAQKSKTGAVTKLEDGGAMGSHTILSKLD